MKKLMTLAILAVIATGASANIITSLPGSIDMGGFTSKTNSWDSNKNSHKWNSQIVHENSDVFVVGINTTRFDVHDEKISLYSHATSAEKAPYTGLAFGYKKSGNNASYSADLGETLYFSMDFKAADGEDGVPKFSVDSFTGDKSNGLTSFDWTSTETLADGTVRYIFDASKVEGWGENPNGADGFTVNIGMGTKEGFDYGSYADGKYIGDVSNLVIQVPEPATIGLFGIGFAGAVFARRRRASK